MKKPNVALVFGTKIDRNAFHGMLLPALGLERLGAAVEDIAHVELFDVRFEPRLLEKINRFKPDYVGLNVKTTLYSEQSYKIGREIRRIFPQTTIITGGLHATACPEESFGFANYVVRGEGEIPFRQIISGKKPNEISSLVFRDNGIIKKNDLESINPNLDYLRPPARHLRRKNYRYSASGQFKMDILETSRGCTHACSFCSGGSVYPHQYRVHSPEYVFEEVKRMHEMGVKWCMLSDDHFGDYNRVEKICDLIIESGIKIAFFSFIRPFDGRMELKRKMVKAGFVMLSYGAESPSREQKVRYGKGHPKNSDFIKNVNEQWYEAGATYIGNSYVFGDINDSAESLRNLGVYARRQGPTYIEPLYAQPYPGTKYREELKREGHLISNKGWSDFTEGRMLVRHPELDEQELKKLRVNAWLDFFTPKKLMLQFMSHLHFYENLNVPRWRVLYHLKTSDYTLFGCYLEDKYYQEYYGEMIDVYFRKKIHTFEKSEMELEDARLDGLTNMIGLKLLKDHLRDANIEIRFTDKKEDLAIMIFEIRKKKIKKGYITTKYEETDYPKVQFEIPLPYLKNQLVGNTLFGRIVATLEIVAKNIIPSTNQLAKISLGWNGIRR